MYYSQVNELLAVKYYSANKPFTLPMLAHSLKMIYATSTF